MFLISVLVALAIARRRSAGARFPRPCQSRRSAGPWPPRRLSCSCSSPRSSNRRFSGVTITGGDGQAIATGAAAVDPQNRAEMVLKLPPLAPGHYRMSWHAVSVDTHRTEGTFSFDIQP